MIVDCNRFPVQTGMYRRENAEQEAEELNRTGVPEGRPYRVVLDVVASELDK